MKTKEEFTNLGFCYCIHYKTCRYLDKQRKLGQENEMYGMFEYLEWNNINKIFAKHVRCQFREAPKDEDLRET